jgi:hypothetical protein
MHFWHASLHLALRRAAKAAALHPPFEAQTNHQAIKHRIAAFIIIQ